MSSSPQIRVLSDTVANMIAAGEVVERPSSVLKELMENAIDSGAGQVDVEIVSGGRKLLSVADDGSGMGRDDALLSIERHATSKISDVHDIEHIGTLGFRGEALASICSVSRFRLKTCASETEGGTEITISGGKILGVEDCGGPRGTTITVRDLFFNVPARRKFMRSERTELSHIRQYFIVQALARPDVGMSLTVDSRELYRLAAGAGVQARLQEMFGSDFCRNLVPVDGGEGGVAVSGFVSAPGIHRGDRSEQFFFVNTRPISAPLLSNAAKEGYHTLLPGNRYGSVFLFITLDPELVDVNVHPAKREVRFRRPSEVRAAAISAIRSALATAGFGEGRSGSAFGGARGAATDDVQHVDAPSTRPRLSIDDLPSAKSFKYPSHAQPEMESVTADTGGRGPEKGSDSKSSKLQAPSSELRAPQAPWAWCRVMGQVGGLYVLIETDDGFVIMDPHAAHERVLYEQFVARSNSRTVESQGLLAPETVSLAPSDARRVRANMELLKEMGFGVAEFGGDSFVVDALPSFFAGTSADMLVKELARALEESSGRGASLGKEQAIAQAACKTAVKARDRMSLAEIEQLVVDLGKCEMPYTCPHGRPTLIYSSLAELRKKFGRE